MSVVQNKVVVLDFTVLASKPKPADVEKFVARDLKVQRQQLKCVQMLTTGKTLLEFYDPAAAKNATTTNLRHSMQCDGKLTPIPVYFKEDTVEVKIYDLSHEVPAEKIAKSMSRFGKVLTLERDKWRRVFVGIDNGVYLLRMQLNRHIPKRLSIDGHISTILYTGQPRNQLKRKRKKHTNKSKTSNENNNNKNNNTSNAINNNTNNNNTSNENNNNDAEEQARPEPDNDDDGNNEEEEPTQPEMEQDAEGFEVVRSKHDRKTLKRQHSKENETPAKLPGHQRADFFGRRWLEARRKSKEAVDAVSKQQAERMKTLYKEKFQECYFKLPQEEKKQVTVLQDINDYEFYSD